MIAENVLKEPLDRLELCLRDCAYGASGRADLVRDVMGLANLPGDQPRHMVFGVSRAADGALQGRGLSDADLAEIETYPEVIGNYLEPAVGISVECCSYQGKVIAVLSIGGGDRPYMVSTDLSQDMRVGACWVREPGIFRPARRRDFDAMYGGRRSDPDAGKSVPVVQIGFNQDPAQTELITRLPDLNRSPSVVAAKRLQDQIEVVRAAGERNVADSSVARLVHAQQYGSETPYDERGVNTLVEAYNGVEERYYEEDDYFFQETAAFKLSLMIRNNGSQPLEQLSVVLTLPVVDDFRPVEQLCPAPGNERSRHESDLLGYPNVRYYKSAVQVKQDIDQLPAGASQPLFETALRIACKPGIAGKKVAVRYALHARGLSEPEQGVLKVCFGR